MMTKKTADLFKVSISFSLIVVTFQNCAPGFQVGGSLDLASNTNSLSALASKSAFGPTGLKRLTAYELENSVESVFGADATSFVSMLPSDEYQTTPFNNEWGAQAIAPITIENYRSFAEAYSASVVAQPNFATKFRSEAGCAPRAANDAACLAKYFVAAGSRILRRPLSQAEADDMASKLIPIAASENNFYSGVELGIQAWLQNPEFLYRIQAGRGEVEPGVLALTDYEIATALSYLLVGDTPDSALLEKASKGELKLASVRASEAKRILASAKARLQWQRFHSQWFGYDSAVLPANLEADMFQESNKLVDRVVFEEDADWMKLLTIDETYLTPALAASYGVPGVTRAGWTKFSGGRGGGLLAHATFLSKGSKFGDTSPTLRGYETYKRLMCGKLGPIPADVNIDRAPGSPTDCKPARYNMRQFSSCATCHNVTDNIGFGLENFGPLGQWRTTEPGNANCAVDNRGTINGVGYSGPAELGKILASDPAVPKCAVTQLFQFFAARPSTTDDVAVIEALNVSYRYTGKGSLQSLLISLVEAPAFIHKVR